jgi:hypothetical protein
MVGTANGFAVYLEVGEKRVVAGALEWPGWCRIGRDEESALQALVAYGPRYSRVVHGAQLEFTSPADPADFTVVERLKGDSATEFGVAAGTPSRDADPFGEDDLRRATAILRAVWRAFDAAVESAQGKELRKGPRGGGREAEKIVRHVWESEQSYLRNLGWRLEKVEGEDPGAGLGRLREGILEALAAGMRGELPETGPRGGKLWKPRYFVRRSAWHILDHTWEIEDRIE